MLPRNPSAAMIINRRSINIITNKDEKFGEKKLKLRYQTTKDSQ
jgi:hypothetical protein